MSEQTRMFRKPAVTQGSYQQGLYLMKTPWGSDCGHPAGPLCAVSSELSGGPGDSLEKLLEGAWRRSQEPE